MELDLELFYRAALEMPVGELPLSNEGAPYMIHRWKDCWWALFTEPRRNRIGVELPTENELKCFIFRKPSPKIKLLDVPPLC